MCEILSSGFCVMVAQRLKRLPAMRETWVRSLGREDPPREGNGKPTPVFLPGESHGRRSLVGYSPRAAKSRIRLSDFTFFQCCLKRLNKILKTGKIPA